MAGIKKRTKTRFLGMTSFQITVVFILGFLLELVVGFLAFLIIKNSITDTDGQSLSTLYPVGTKITTETSTATQVEILTVAATFTPTFTWTSIPTILPSPSRTKAPTWTLIPQLITPTIAYTPLFTLESPTSTNTLAT
jgi:hypothetical protein